MSEGAAAARSTPDASTGNTLTMVQVSVRLQICGGTPDELGIASADWVLLREGAQVGSGTTPANGQIDILMLPNETLALQVFGTEYDISLHGDYASATTTAGQQKRLDTLGYIVGYLSDAMGSAKADDGIDGARTRQAVLCFQTDQAIAIDSVAGNQTQGKLKTAAGA